MKHHNNLEDSQIHKPKGFSGANNRSLPIKNASGNLEWEKCNYTTSLLITCVADVGGNLHHSYFSLCSSYDAAKYAVYLQITDTVVMATPTGYDGVIAANVSATGVNSTATNIGDAIQTVLNAHSDFTASDNNAGAVTVTGLTTATNAYDNDTGFVFASTQTKVTSEVLTTDSSGNIVWNSQTNLLSDTIEFQGYGALNTNYSILRGFENNQDGRFGIDFGSADNTDDISPQNALRSGRFIAARDYTLNRWTGVLSNTNSDICTIELWRVTPVDDSNVALSMTVLKSLAVTGKGNDKMRTFDLDLTGEANRTITKGDIVIFAAKNDDGSSTFFLNSSLRLEYKI
tara:strand:- start:3108 stop:4139 length:1032 start_codon:yes stop_codon:yes gene_type:complete